MKYYRCDCCGKIVEEPFTIKLELDKNPYDVCTECYNKIRNQLREFAPRCGTCKFYASSGLCCINKRGPATGGHNPYNSPCAGYEKLAIGAWKTIDTEEDTNE